MSKNLSFVTKYDSDIASMCINKPQIVVSEDLKEGINKCSNDYIVVMSENSKIIKKGWDIEIIEKLIVNPQSILAFPLINAQNKQTYYPGGFNLFSKDVSKMLTPYLKKDIISKDIDIPCVSGGIYAFCRSWYNKLQGINGLSGNFLAETFLSIKSYLSGGNCKLIKDSKVEYDFNKTAIVDEKLVLFNKIVVGLITFPDGISSIPLNMLSNRSDIMDMFKGVSGTIFKHKLDYENEIIYPFEKYVEKFGLGILT